MTDHPSEVFFECYRDCFRHQHIRSPTHYRSMQKANILDIVLPNEENLVKNVEYKEPVGMIHLVTLSWVYQCLWKDRSLE